MAGSWEERTQRKQLTFAELGSDRAPCPVVERVLWKGAASVSHGEVGQKKGSQGSDRRAEVAGTS